MARRHLLPHHPTTQAEPPVLTIIIKRHLAMLDSHLTPKTILLILHFLTPNFDRRHTNTTRPSRSRIINLSNADLRLLPLIHHRRRTYSRPCLKHQHHTHNLITARMALLPSHHHTLLLRQVTAFSSEIPKKTDMFFFNFGQFPSHIYSNGTTWPAPTQTSASPSSPSPAPARTATSWPTHGQQQNIAQTTATNYATVSSSSPSSSYHRSQSAERSSMSGAGAGAPYAPNPAATAQNGNATTATAAATATPSAAATMQSSRSWRGSPYVPSVGGGGGGNGGGAGGLPSYYSSRSPQPQPSPQHRAP